jgi:6-phosphogluconolactonase
MTSTVRGNVEIFPTVAELTAAAAERFVEAADAAIEATETFSVALSGGSTPRDLFTVLATPEYSSRVRWPRVHVYWGDERCVPPDDAESNYRMARELMLDHVPVPAANIHRIRGEDAPWAAAGRYERELRAAFGAPAGPPRRAPGSRFDLVLLGLGADGHTASLFPHQRAVRERARRWAMAENVETLQAWRVTLTPVILNEAAEVVFLVAGREKAAILRRVLYGPRDTNDLPAQAIAPVEGRLRWLVDAAAAADLPSP